jgi:hypothetical protein
MALTLLYGRKGGEWASGPQGAATRAEDQMKGTGMKRLALILAVACMLGWGGAVGAQDEAPAEATDQQSLQQQIDELKARLADYEQLKQRLAELESAAAKESAAPQPAQPQPVQPAFPNTKIKIDGRLFAGAFETGDQGPFPNPTLDIPDAKLRFTFAPSKDVTVVMRYSNNRANTNGFDYFYADLNNYLGAIPGHLLRVGKFKIDVGQETWIDNPVENILITNSISHVSGYDEGLNFRGPISGPAIYSVGLMNGSKGVSPADSGATWSAKTGIALTPQTFVSASYARTGNLVKANGSLDQPDLNVAEISTAPADATAWRRSLWEVDARYGYGKQGIASVVGAPPATRWQGGATYGQFTDAATGAPDRKGTYWFLEGLYNVTPKVYLASRFSTIALNDDVTASIGGSPVPVNSYDRLAFGVGYRFTDMTHLKAEYTRNTTSGATPEPDLNQFAVGIATKF